jgi:hypothetical protein
MLFSFFAEQSLKLEKLLFLKIDISKRFEAYQKRVERKFAEVDAKLSFMQDSISGVIPDRVRTDLKDIKDEIGEFMQFSSEYLSDHEKRISAPGRRGSSSNQ